MFNRMLIFQLKVEFVICWTHPKLVGLPRFELGSLCLRGRTSPSKFHPHIVWLRIWVTIPASHWLTVKSVHHARILRNKIGGCGWSRTNSAVRRKIYSLLGLPVFLHIHNTTGSTFKFLNKRKFQVFAELILKLVPSYGIGPSSHDYQSCALPLSYKGN